MQKNYSAKLCSPTHKIPIIQLFCQTYRLHLIVLYCLHDSDSSMNQLCSNTASCSPFLFSLLQTISTEYLRDPLIVLAICKTIVMKNWRDKCSLRKPFALPFSPYKFFYSNWRDSPNCFHSSLYLRAMIMNSLRVNAAPDSISCAPEGWSNE